MSAVHELLVVCESCADDSALLFTGPTIYKTLGYGVSQQLLYACGWQTFSLGAAILACFVVELMARPYMLMLGLGICLTMLSIEAALVAEFVPSTNSNALRAAVAVIFLYVFGFQGCLNGTQWAYISELWPSHMRPKGISMGMVAIMLTNICFVSDRDPTVIFKTSADRGVLRLGPSCANCLCVCRDLPSI